MHDAALFEIGGDNKSNNESKKLTLYNAFGQVVKTAVFQNNRLLLQSDDLPQGCYFYKINSPLAPEGGSNVGVISSGKIVVIH